MIARLLGGIRKDDVGAVDVVLGGLGGKTREEMR